MTVGYWLAAYSLSTVGGFFIVGGCLYVMRASAGLERASFKVVDLWLGCTERVVGTTLVIFAPRYLAAFVGGWVALKFAANWKRRDPDIEPDVSAGSLLALVGSVISFAIAIGAGLLIYPDAADVWFRGQ